jgi:DNA topoisomerase-3
MKTLVIAEKPSVAQDIVRALTPVAGKFEKHDEYISRTSPVRGFTSAVGHLLEIQAPEAYRRETWQVEFSPICLSSPPILN